MITDIRSYGGFFMDYKKNYNYYMAYVRTLNRKKGDLDSNGNKIYYAWHHILPRCIGGSDDLDNQVLLKGREHYLAHYLLTKIYSDNLKLLYAFKMMHQGYPAKQLGYSNSRLYESNQIRFVRALSLSKTGSRCSSDMVSKCRDSSIKNESYKHFGEYVILGSKRDAKFRMKLSLGHMKMVRCVEKMLTFPSLIKACEWAGLYSTCTISNCIAGRQKTAAGYHWEYV